MNSPRVVAHSERATRPSTEPVSEEVVPAPMVKKLRSFLQRSRVLNFNQVERDLWVRRQAACLAKGSSVLDVGAGNCPYRACFQHCSYQTQDFASLTPDQLRDRKGYGTINYACDATAIPVPDNHF